MTYAWGSLMATTFLYPGKSLPLYLKGGLGYMHTSISDDFDDVSSSHFAFQLGTGYDLKIAKGSAITFYFNWIKGLSGSLEVNGDHLADVVPRSCSSERRSRSTSCTRCIWLSSARRGDRIP